MLRIVYDKFLGGGILFEEASICVPVADRVFSYRTDFQKTVQRIIALDYKIPEKLQLSDSVKDLLAKIFVKDPAERIDIAGIKQHEWYLHRLPFELSENYQGMERCALC